ncbi:bifunctional metallophosphatase/5'-nucleotidase [Glaciecola sp. 1036]|uniref:bifunctional metallophosphatase/5'-nucleotidase n=1 Tax=Alteromonadaceae TaxID=72275 RepID=UPI003D037D7C
MLKKSHTISVLVIGIVAFNLNAEIKEITLLHTNDIESVYEPLEAAWRDDIELIGGTPYLATLIEQVRAKETTSFLFDAGDIYTGALSKKSKGKLPFDLYTAMKYDVITLGNHEFEYGWQSLIETMPRAGFPVLNANIVHKDSGTMIAQPYTILERDGVRIGVVGVMGIDAFYNTTAVFQREELTIKDPIETAQYWVDLIRPEVNMVVVLTHQNKTAPMQTNKESDPSVQRGFHEDYAMAGKLKGVDVIFGGHSDNGLPEPEVHPDTGTVIGITFGQAMHLGYTKFKVDTQGHNVEFIEGRLIPVDAGKLKANQKALGLIQAQRAKYPEVTEHVGILDKAAMRRYNKESSIGNLLTDMMRKSADSDIAMMNSGGIRADLNAGEITREHLINVYPFVDKLSVVELSGKQVRELIEYSCTLPYGIGQFSGVEIVYDSSLPEMQRVKSISINGTPLVIEQNYSVATTAFVAKGGDGYSVFTKGKPLASDTMMADALFDGLHQLKQVTLPSLGRQVDLAE